MSEMPDTGRKPLDPEIAKLGRPNPDLKMPSVGRIVHYVLSPIDGAPERQVGKHRAAIVNEVHNRTCIDITIFYNGENDGFQAPSTGVRTSVFEGSPDQVGTWHWPEYVP